jgi:hypothetical protein
MLLRSAILLVIGIVSAVVVVLIVSGRLATCPAALIGLDHQMAGPVLCQLEFFLNRYQTLLGSLIALCAAIYAVRPVWRQLRLVSVQAATDLLPHLRQEADELGADEGFLGGASQIAAKLRMTEACANDPRRPTNIRVGDAIGEIQSIGQTILLLRSSGAVDQFANRITLTTSEQGRRRTLVTILENVSLACEKIMGIVKPPGGLPIAPYYEGIAPQFSAAVEENFPPVLKLLASEIVGTKADVERMRAELQSRTELAIRAAKGFAGQLR